MRGLLHRLVATDRSRRDTVQEIVEHLRVMLNTHSGDGHAAPEFGVDLHTLLIRWPSSREQLTRGIEGTISRFEPRLKNVEVSISPNPTGDTLLVDIRARTPSEDELRMRASLARGRGLGLQVHDADA